MSGTNNEEPLLTRRQALEYINALGFPIRESYFNKICLPARNEGPRIERRWGHRPLYRAEDVKIWALARCKAPMETAA